MSKRSNHQFDGGKLEFPTYFREWRKFRGLTQKEVAARCGITDGTISFLENRQAGYSQFTLEAVANALDCYPSELLAFEPTDASIEQEIGRVCKMIPFEEKRLLLEMARGLVASRIMRDDADE